MFNFLKLRKSSSGDARRHVPFISIINKQIFASVLCFIFIICISTSISVKAFGIGIPVPLFPIAPYSAESLEPNYELLNEDQKNICHEILGTYYSLFFAANGVGLNSPSSTPRQLLRKWGHAFITAYFSSTYQNQLALNNMVGSTIQKSSTYESYNDYANETAPSVSQDNHVYLEYPKELTVTFKNWIAAHNFDVPLMGTIPWATTYVWNQHALSGDQADAYNDLLSDIEPSKRVYGNINYAWPSYSNAVLEFPEKYNLFINTTTNEFYLVRPDGTRPNDFYCRMLYCDSSGNPYITAASVVFYSLPLTNCDFYNQGLPMYMVVREIFNRFDVWACAAALGHWDSDAVGLKSTKVIDKVFVGPSWGSSQELYNIDDIEVTVPDSVYIDNIPDTAYIDANGVIDSLDQADADANLKDVVYPETLVKQGDEAVTLSPELTQAIDRYLTQPVSAVTVDPNIFNPFFNDGRGFIYYMWSMTKPLIRFSRDLLACVTYGPDGQFSESGPGFFILGVVSCGLIGGFVSKCLL